MGNTNTFSDPIDGLPRSTVGVNAAMEIGHLELRRHSIGHGGVNPLPLPDVVVEGARQLQLPLIRVSLQEFFFILPEKNTLDFSRLDPYMDSLEPLLNSRRNGLEPFLRLYSGGQVPRKALKKVPRKGLCRKVSKVTRSDTREGSLACLYNVSQGYHPGKGGVLAA